MEVVASIDFEQYKAALAALQFPGGVRSNNLRQRYTALGISFVIMISFLLAYSAHNNLTNQSLVFVGVIVLYAAALSLHRWSKSRYDACLKKVFDAQENHLQSQPMTITEHGVSGKSSDSTFSDQYEWAAFVRLIDLPDGLLFLPNAASFVRIPKAPLSSEDLSQIMAWWTPHARSQR